MNASGSGSSDNSGKGFFGLPTKWLVIGGIVLGLALALCCGGSLVNSYANNQTGGKAKQAELTAAYADAANYMSNCVTKTFQAASTATANAEAAARLIREAVAGQGNATNVDLNTSAGRNAFYPMLVQSWPELSGQTALFNRVIDVIVGCQDDFRSKQSAVIDQVRSFNTWRGNFWGSKLGRGSFPDDDLVINLPGVPVSTGAAALLKMGQPIITTDTAEAYKTGITNPTNPFPGNTPAPTSSPK